MSKVIKLKQSDIEGIVTSLISEQEESETQLNPTKGYKEGLVIGKGEDGRIYIINGLTGDIVDVD
jgi:hypothetical protein